jgi:hypothetical protein
LSSDAWVSLGRVGAFLTAEELPPPYPVDKSSKYAINCDGDFTWEVSDPAKADGGADKKGKGGPGGPKGKGKDKSKDGKKDKTADKKDKKDKKDKNADKKEKSKKNGEPSKDPAGSGSGTATATGTIDEGGDDDVEESGVFHLNNLKIKVPKGQFVALVGKIGSGKSSCLNALIGEMRKTRGSVRIPISILSLTHLSTYFFSLEFAYLYGPFVYRLLLAETLPMPHKVHGWLMQL